MRTPQGGFTAPPPGSHPSPRSSNLAAPALPVEPTDLRAWKRTRLRRTTRSALSASSTRCRQTAPDELIAHAMRRSGAHALAQGDAKQLALAITGAPLPAARLESLQGHHLPLGDLAVGWLIVYCFPGSHVGTEESHLDDERDHHAYACYHAQLERRAIRIASLSSAPSDLQIRTMLTHRLAYHIMLDPELRVADELGLPTFSEGESRAYCRLTLIARDGVIEHVFYPIARGGRSAKQALTWMELHVGLDSLYAG